ncbi:MAG: hypothetical protein ACPGNT_03720 [Rhodospirillales bacterium]
MATQTETGLEHGPLRDGMRALVAEALGTGDGRLVMDAVETAFSFVDAFADEQLLFDRKIGAVACARTCGFCCAFLQVQATALEVLAIGERIRADWPDEERQALVTRLALQDAHRLRPVTTLHGDGFPAHSCALLQGALCGSQDGHPSRCQGALIQEIAGIGQDGMSPDGMWGESPRSGGIAQAAQDGLRLALRDAGRDSELVDLIGALLIVLRDRHTLSRWMSGEDVFETARPRVLAAQ